MSCFFFLLHAGAAEGWGVYSPAPSHCTVFLPQGQRGLPNPTLIFGDFCVRILILKIKSEKKNLFSISAGGKQGEHWEEGGETVIDGEGSPSPEAPVECPELGCSSLWGVPNPGAAFQDKGGWGGVGRGWAGGGAGKRAIRAVAQAGGSQAGHGGCPRGAATGSRRRPRAPGPPGLLGLRCAGHRPESAGGCLQSSPAGAGAGDHPAARCHHARLWLPLPLPGECAPRGVRVGVW